MGQFTTDGEAEKSEMKYLTSSEKHTDIGELPKGWFCVTACAAILVIVALLVVVLCQTKATFTSSGSDSIAKPLDSALRTLDLANKMVNDTTTEQKKYLDSTRRYIEQVQNNSKAFHNNLGSEFTFYGIVVLGIVGIVIAMLWALTTSHKHTLQARVAELEILSQSLIEAIKNKK